MLFTRENFSKTIDLTALWNVYELPKNVTKLRITISGDAYTNLQVAIALREIDQFDPYDVEGAFLLGLAHNFFIDNHVCKTISFRRQFGVNGKIHIEGLKKRKY